jgi:hypothetical protein
LRLPVIGLTLRAAGSLLVLFISLERAMAIEPPQDEVSVGYNLYEGGGITVQGPAVIVKKALLKRMSLKAGARVDLISSASIDVVTQASRYKETRKEYSLGTSLLQGETLTGIDYTNSTEADYTSNTLSVGLAHDLFEKNTTLSLRAGRSWDQVGKNGDPAFGWREFNRTIYAAGIAQSLTPRWLIQLNYEATAETGFINNPYRSVFTQDGGTAPENYPEARTGHAWVVRTGYGFFSRLADGGTAEQKSSVQLQYRYYQDTFDVRSHTGKILVQRYLDHGWLLGSFYQYQRQGEASFYGDRVSPTQVFKARDKELSRFTDHWIGASAKYKPKQYQWRWLENPYLQFSYGFLMYDYDNFTDPRTGELYSQRAHVLHTSIGFDY